MELDEEDESPLTHSSCRIDAPSGLLCTTMHTNARSPCGSLIERKHMLSFYVPG